MVPIEQKDGTRAGIYWWVSVKGLTPTPPSEPLKPSRGAAVRDHAAREWCSWEDAHVSLTPGHLPNPRYADPEFRLRFARLVTHYWRHAAFLGVSIGAQI